MDQNTPEIGNFLHGTLVLPMLWELSSLEGRMVYIHVWWRLDTVLIIGERLRDYIGEDEKSFSLYLPILLFWIEDVFNWFSSRGPTIERNKEQKHCVAVSWIKGLWKLIEDWAGIQVGERNRATGHISYPDTRRFIWLGFSTGLRIRFIPAERGAILTFCWLLRSQPSIKKIINIFQLFLLLSQVYLLC